MSRQTSPRAVTAKFSALLLLAGIALVTAAAPGVGLQPSAKQEKTRKNDAPNRVPVPSDAAVTRAEAAVRLALKDDFARKQPSDRKALAQKLIKLAGETSNDPAARYVMMTEALDLAVGLTDPALARDAIDKLAIWYNVEAPALQLAALKKILGSTVVSLADVKNIIDFAGPAADKALDTDDHDAAVEFAQLALAATRKAKLGQTATDGAENRLTHAKKTRDAFTAILPALDSLASNPDDPRANSAVGKFRCFVQGRWDDGLKHLAKADDPALRAVVDADLKVPRDKIPDDTTVADAWAVYAKTAPTEEQWPTQVRARYWYARSLPGLAGLTRTEAEKGLGLTVGETEYRPGLVSELTAKFPAVLKGSKARVDKVLDFSGGEFADVRMTDLRVKWVGALAPPRAGPYTLVAQTSDPVRVLLDGKTLIDTIAVRTSRKEAPVMLGERPHAIFVDYLAPNAEKHKIKLAWVVPGKTAEELIPAEYLFHDKKAESVLK